MAGYDFKSLSPYDFEELCHDLMEKELGFPLEAFKAGRDSGIDLRHAFSSSNAIIVQCKHYADSGFSKLLAVIKNSETIKLARLKPSRYIIATSVGLTPDNSRLLAEVATPYCSTTGDIYGRERLNAILRTNPDIITAHFKLWLTSEPLLQRILHNSAFVRSAMDRHDIQTKIKLFVQTGAVRKAKDILDKEHACIISGEPGIGKTTLAQILLAAYVGNDWELVSARENVRELLDVYRLNPETKQVFYYDDFLGTMKLDDEQFAKNEDKSLVQLLHYARDNPKKRVILTTREYILRKAQIASESLATGRIDLNKYLLTLSDYTEEDKAKILANHLYFKGVSTEHINSIITQRNYLKIITHANYSPRIIEYMTDATQMSNVTSEAYFNEFMKNLNHPDLIWKQAFERKLNTGARNVLLCFASCGDKVLIDDLRIVFDSFHLMRAAKYHCPASPLDFQDGLSILEGSFIRISPYKSGTVIEPLNPSVLDFLRDEIRRDVVSVRELIETAQFYEQIERLISLMEEGKIEDRIRNVISKVQAPFVASCNRLIDGGSLRMSVHTWRKPVDVTRTPVDHSARIIFLIEMSRVANDAAGQSAVQSAADKYFIDAPIKKYGPSDYVPLLESLSASDWIDAESLKRWHGAIAPCFNEPIDGWEDAKLLAFWLDDQLDRYDEEIIETARCRITEVMESEADDAHSSSDLDRIQGTLDDIKGLDGIIAIDITSACSSLTSRIEELKAKADHDRRRDDDYDDWYVAPARSVSKSESSSRVEPSNVEFNQRYAPPPSAIDRIFDSLGEG